jgi:hypothetical protein
VDLGVGLDAVDKSLFTLQKLRNITFNHKHLAFLELLQAERQNGSYRDMTELTGELEQLSDASAPTIQVK